MMFLIKKLPQITFMWIPPAKKQTRIPYQIEKGQATAREPFTIEVMARTIIYILACWKHKIPSEKSYELLFSSNGFIM